MVSIKQKFEDSTFSVFCEKQKSPIPHFYKKIVSIGIIQNKKQSLYEQVENCIILWTYFYGIAEL